MSKDKEVSESTDGENDICGEYDECATNCSLELQDKLSYSGTAHCNYFREREAPSNKPVQTAKHDDTPSKYTTEQLIEELKSRPDVMWNKKESETMDKKKANNIRIESLEKQLNIMGEVITRLDGQVQLMQTQLAQESYFLGRMKQLEFENAVKVKYIESLGGNEEGFQKLFDEEIQSLKDLAGKKKPNLGILGPDGKELV